MEEDEDFEALFFSEARELLDALQEHLNALADGDGDSETIHAAFRAVHSVKGGAAAFGFESLIAFAHIFETVMDRIRGGDLAIDDQIAQILLRSGDMMQVLVENAQNHNDEEAEGVARLTHDLETLADGGTPSAAPAPERDARSAKPQAAEPDPAPAPAAPVPPAASREYTVRFTPEADFFDGGHDMLRLVRAARDLGLAALHVEGDLPPPAAFDPRICPLSWELVFRTELPGDRIAEFFDVYQHMAHIEFHGFDESPDDESAELDEVADADPQPTVPASEPAGPEPAAPQAQPGEPRESSNAHRQAENLKSLRVEIVRIDRLVNLVGEMLITQAALAQQLSEASGQDSPDLAMPVETMSRQLRELQESVMAIRAQPVKSVFRRMPRVVRDLAEKLGKEARIDLYGENTEVDSTVIEELTEPLTHMIRNSMDHGLEGNDEREAAGKPRIGQIRLSAEHRGERVIITVEDDGRGVNREKVLAKAIERGLVSPEDQLSPEDIDMLIFHPGFSTADTISSVSGRGVGMDVVKKKIVSLGGRCALTSIPGQGARFTITLPLTLAVMDGMAIRVGDQKYILPLSSVIEALRVPRGGGNRLPNGSRLLERRGQYIKLFDLRTALSMPQDKAESDMAIIVDSEVAGNVALIVDELIGQRQIVLKSLETNFTHVDGISGATILGDGQVALILDVPALIRPQAAQLPEHAGHLQETLH